MPKTKLIKLTFLLLVTVFISAGCGKQAPAPIGEAELVIWKPFVPRSDFQDLINAYQSTHPQVRIEYVERNIDTYEEDLLNALAAGNGPDIFAINNSWLPRYIDKTIPAPATVYTLKQYQDQFVDILSSDFTYGGQIYGTALSVDALGLYYNKDILGTVGYATPPKTWEDLSSYTRKITKQDSTGYFTRSGVALGTSANVNRAPDIMYLLMLQNGVRPWSEDLRNPQFNRTDNVDATLTGGEGAIEFYTSFANPNSANYTWNQRSDYSIDAFANGRSAMIYGYSYVRQLIDAKSPNLNYDVAPVPQVNFNNPSVNYANYFGEVVNKQTKYSAAAWDFLKFITTQSILEPYSQNHRLASSRKDIIEKQVQDVQIGVFAHANLTAKSFYQPDQARMDEIFNTMIDNVILRGIQPSQALGQANNQAGTLTRLRN